MKTTQSNKRFKIFNAEGSLPTNLKGGGVLGNPIFHTSQKNLKIQKKI